MERTLVSFSVPNLITVPIMALGGFLFLAVIYQVGSAVAGRVKGGDTPAPASGY